MRFLLKDVVGAATPLVMYVFRLQILEISPCLAMNIALKYLVDCDLPSCLSQLMSEGPR